MGNADYDEQLAQLLADLTEQQRNGQEPQVEHLAREHPELAGELRELWAVVQFAGVMTSSTRTTESAAPATESSTKSASLPRPFADYELLEELGRGGMGIVYKARQRDPERIVALKVLLSGDQATGADLARFRAEVRAATRLNGHAHIVPVLEGIKEHEGQLYFTMSFIHGTTLARAIESGPLPPREAARIVAAIADAIQYAHEKGVLHRDLKPSNVLLDAHGNPYVTDFGLAKRVQGGESLTQTGAILGTPSYMPPERVCGSPRPEHGPAGDIYGLGAVLYELLTSQPPFRAVSPMDTMLKVLNEDIVPPRERQPLVDRDLELICVKCLQKPVELRYATAGELADALQAYLRGESISLPLSLRDFLARLLSETQHAPLLENWGLLWMWHSLALFCLCLLTNACKWAGIQSPWPYLGIWTLGFGTWAAIFWALRRRAGPVTFVERQIAHVWAASTAASVSLFILELLLGLPVLTLSPVLGVIGGMVFLVKAGMLSGSFYLAAAASFATALLMALFPSIDLVLFGLVSAACFFFYGLKYHRRHIRAQTR